jgi:hypothetical protein
MLNRAEIAQLSERVPRRRLRLRSVAIAATAAAALALPASALASGFTASASIPTHTPKIGNEKITVYATKNGKKLSGNVSYHFLFQGQVVSRQSGGNFKNGVYHDTLKWPAEAVGSKLTLQIVIKTNYGTDYINYWIDVKK